jgi:hypothetical protein
MLHVHPTGTLQPATVERLLREENPAVGRDAISYAKAFGAAELQFLRDYPGDVRYLALRPEDQARFRALFVLPENRSDFRRFAAIFPLVGWLRQLPNVDAWQIITDDFFARAQAQRVRYAEWTMHVEPNAEALRQLQTTAARAQERYGITLRVNAAFDRAASPRDNAAKLQQLIRSLSEQPSRVLVGIDLAGDEAGRPPSKQGSRCIRSCCAMPTCIARCTPAPAIRGTPAMRCCSARNGSGTEPSCWRILLSWSSPRVSVSRWRRIS